MYTCLYSVGSSTSVMDVCFLYSKLSLRLMMFCVHRNEGNDTRANQVSLHQVYDLYKGNSDCIYMYMYLLLVQIPARATQCVFYNSLFCFGCVYIYIYFDFLFSHV